MSGSISALFMQIHLSVFLLSSRNDKQALMPFFGGFLHDIKKTERHRFLFDVDGNKKLRQRTMKSREKSEQRTSLLCLNYLKPKSCDNFSVKQE